MKKLFQEKEDNQQFILTELQKGNERVFDFVFKEYYVPLIRFSYSFVKEQDRAENLVQDVFVKLWEKRERLSKVDNILSYLMGMIRNQCIDSIRKEKADSKAYLNIRPQMSANTTEEQISKNEFEEVLLKSILRLPERCRMAFELSRFDGYTNKEIAQRMAISLKGVEALIGRALKQLRIELKELLPSSSDKNARGTFLFALFVKRLKRLGISVSD
ncbi:MAG TPA: RNA polymerase sigma-70 factor [Prolixibacteraceae bacterium]|nr:RNA polymerase sigma-70 factor [Prolixibacteraceae bacterium]